MKKGHRRARSMDDINDISTRSPNGAHGCKPSSRVSSEHPSVLNSLADPDSIVFVHGIFGHPRETWTSHRVDRDAEQSSDPPDSIGSAQASEAKQGKKSRLSSPWKKKVVRTGLQAGGSRPSITEQVEAECSDKSNHYEGVFWPADLLPAVLPQSRIFTWGYDVDINHMFSSASQATVFQHAETLLSALADERSSPQEGARPLIFVAHSLGGIIVKDMLNTSRNEQNEYLNEILSSTYGIVFLGTPHRGSATASLLTIAQGITKAFLKSPNTSVLRDLKVNSQTLDRIGRGFSQTLVKQSIKIQSFQEELPTNGVMVVEPFSSDIGHGLEVRNLIHADHHRMTKFSGPSDEGFRQVSAVLARWARKIVETTEQSQVPREENTLEELPFMVPFERDPDFTGREEILAKLEKGFRSRRRLALVGLGGVGKSQIAIEYAYRLRDSSPLTTVLWAHGGDQERFRESYRTIADALKLSGPDDRKTDMLALVKQWLCSAESGTWLLIVDNVDDLTVFTEKITDSRRAVNGKPHVMASLSSYIPNYKNGSILITSRSRSAALQLTTAGTCLVDVSSMSEIEATKLLNSKLPKDGSSVEEFEALAAAMEYLPLAITQAAAYISMGNTVSGYLSLYRNGETSQRKLLQKEFKDIRRDEEIPNYAVLFTWTTSFELIQARNPSATDLLSFMSVLHRQDIPKLLLSKVIEDAYDLEDNLMALIEYSLISARIDNKSYDIHRFVQLATKLRLDRDGLAQMYRSQALASLAKAFPIEHDDPQNWGLSKELLPHANEVSQCEFHGPGDLSNQRFLLHSLGIHLGQTGFLFQSRATLERAVSVSTEVFGLLDRRTIGTQMALSTSLLHTGLFEASEEIAQQIVDLVEPEVRWGTDGIDQLFWARCLSHLALALRFSGKYNKAEELLRNAIRIEEVVLGAENERTSCNVEYLGVLLSLQSKDDEAEFHLRRVLRAWAESKGPNHLDTLRCYHSLGTLLDKKGAYTEAEEAYSKALVGTTAILTEKHPSTLEIAADLMFLRYRYGRTSYPEILTELERVSVTAIQVLGIDHPLVLQAMYIKSYVKSLQGEFGEALSIGRELLNADERVLGPNHPRTLSSLHHLAWIMYHQKDFEQAEVVCERAMAAKETNLGLERLDSLETMRLRLKIVRAQNRHERVLQLKDQLLERLESVLGPEHAKVLWTLTEVGDSLNALGRFAEAEQQLRRVYNSYQRTSDVNDSDFQKMYHRFKTALARQNKFGEMETVSRVCLLRQAAKLGEGHKSTVTYRLDVVTALHGLQRYAEAIDVQLQNLDIEERENGTGDRRTCQALNTLLQDIYDGSHFTGSIIELLLRWREELSQVQHEDACDALLSIARVFEGKWSQHTEESYSTALKLKEKLNEPDSIDVMRLKLDLGRTVFNQGKYSEAAVILKQCVQYFETKLGEKDPITLEAYPSLARALSLSSLADEAEMYARRSLACRSSVSGEPDRDTLISKGDLGVILQSAGKFTESEEVLRQLLVQLEALLGRGDANIPGFQMALAMTLSALGKNEEAEQLAQAAFHGDSANSGLEHRNTFECLSVWARTLRLQGKYSEAEKLGQQAVDGQLRVLNEHHPEILTTLMELAHIYRAQGREGDALTTARDVLDGRIQMLGRQHPLTLEVRSFLGIEAEAPETTLAKT